MKFCDVHNQPHYIIDGKSDCLYCARPWAKGGRLEVTIPPDEWYYCPNCSGSGEDPNTMICVMCGGDGKLDNFEEQK